MIEIDRDVWIAAPESMELKESNRRVLTYSSGERKSLEAHRFAYEHDPAQRGTAAKIQEIDQKLNTNFWYVCFWLPSGEEKQSADFKSREEALAWLGEIGLNLRPFPFKEKKEEECKND